MTTEKMNNGDARMSIYFIEEKGDITRWCDWESRKAAILSRVPELVDAFAAQRQAESLMRVALAKLREIDGEFFDEEES